MHKIKYQEFTKFIKSLSSIEKDNSNLKTTSGLTFLEVLLRSLKDASLKADLKMKIMSENNFSMKISRQYLNNPNLFYKEESSSIISQIEAFYSRDIIKLIDLAYLIIFFESELYEELISKLEFVSAKQHQMLEQFEEIFYKSLNLDLILNCKNPEDLYNELRKEITYNIEIHIHILDVLRKAENDLHKIKYYKKLIKILEEKSILYTTDQSEMEICKEKIYNYELISQSKLISEKYSLNKSILQVENITSNMIIIISEFKKAFNNTRFIKQKIEVMKDFTVFMPFVQFSESTLSERLNIYDFIFSILTINCKEMCHMEEIIRYSTELLEIFFHEDKNVFIENLISKIHDLEKILEIEKLKEEDNFDYIVNAKLLTIQNSKFVVFNETNFLKIINQEKKFRVIKQIRNSLSIFVDIAENICEYEFEMFENEIDSIFEILKRIFNLKIKYLIRSGLETDLKNRIYNLQYKIIKHRLIIVKFEKGNFLNKRDFLIKNPNLCNDYQIASSYLKDVFNTKDFQIYIRNEEEVEKILDLIPEIFFDKSLFIDEASIIIDRLVKSYEILRDTFKNCRALKNLQELEIKEILKIYIKEKRSRNLLKKILPQIIKVKHKFHKHEKIKILSKFHDDNIKEVIEDPVKDYRKSILFYKIGKNILKKKINFRFPEITLPLNLKDEIKIWKEDLKTFKIDCKLFKIFYEETQKKIKFTRKIYKIRRFVNKTNYRNEIEECKIFSKELKYIHYHFSMVKDPKKIDFLIENSLPDQIPKYKILKELSDFQEYPNRNLTIFYLISNFTESDFTDDLKSLKLRTEINQKLEFIKNEIHKISYLNENREMNFEKREMNSEKREMNLENREMNSENRNEIFNLIEKVNLDLHNLLADVNSIDILPQNDETCHLIRNDISDLIFKNNSIKSLLMEICKFMITDSFDLLITELQKPVKEISLDLIKQNNINYRERLDIQITDLKDKVSDLYFVSSDDILNFINGKLDVEDILKNIFNIDRLLIEDNFCMGIESNNEKVIFYNKIEQSHKFKNPEDFKIFYEKFKNEFRNTMELYFKGKSNGRIEFLDEFINEYKYFNNLDFKETTKIKFLKRHEQEMGRDFRLLYPKPRIQYKNDEISLKTSSLSCNLYELTYFPPSNIIYTKLTNTIFNKITLGINTSSGIILYGESSTGKTETVKYYCRSIGKPLFIFCCNENINIDLLENIIKGCIKNNWFLCLDECNRLGSNVMSKMSDLLLEIKDKIKVFLTLNIGYLGRNKLPTTLKALFTEVRVDNPNLEDILDIYFDKQIKDLLINLKERSENLPHYNFSLRAINTILQKSSIDKSLTENLLTYYYAIFSEKDKLLLKDYIDNLTKQDLFTYGINRSTGILLLGNSQSGKSTLLREMISKFKVNYKILHKYDENILYKLVKENPRNDLWIIYDLILESAWIENLNSVLDDNKILCMKNGEILKIGENIKFIFETNNIERVTPATLTRVFTIYFDDQHFKNIEYDESVIFLEGEMGCGKRLYFEEITKGEDALYLNCREVQSLISYDYKLIYLEEYEKASDKLIEEIKEYYEFKTVKDVKKDMNLFVSYNKKEGLKEYNFNKRINCKIVNINKIEGNINKLWINDTTKSLKLDSDKEYLQNNTDLCLKDIIEFLISHKLNFILLGDRLSGKNWLLKDYKLDIKEIFVETLSIEYNKDIVTAILTDDLELLSKKILKENFVIRLINVSQIILDFKEFIFDIENVKRDNILTNKFIKNLKFKKCGCCIKEEIPMTSVNSLENITNKEKEDITNKDIINKDINNRDINNKDIINKEKEDIAKDYITNKDIINLISFPNIFKLTDFINTSLEIYEIYSNNKKFIIDGLDKIQNFHKISQDKKLSLDKHNIALIKYQEELNKKILDIKTLELEINREKLSIENKKNQHSLLYNEIQDKKEFINIRLKEGEAKLEESILKVKRINKKNIAEIRSMNNPPKAVHYIINLIFNIVNNNKKIVPWNELLVFLRSSDIFTVLDCIGLEIDLDIKSLKEREKEISKASHVCFLFYEWIINNYEYKILKEEIKPLEEEIFRFVEEEEIIISNLRKEEEKVNLLNIKLQESRSEHVKYKEDLQNIQNQVTVLNNEIERFDTLLVKIKEERDNWKIPEFNLQYILEKFFKNKILLSQTNINYLSTSTKDINFKKVISNTYKYKNSLFISDAIPSPDIYKLCKFQVKEKDFSLILSQINTEYYSCIGYKYEVREKYSYESSINIKELEDNLLTMILQGDIENILESKKLLDLRREELKKIENIRNHYNKLNEVYNVLYKRYNISFKVYQEFIRKNNQFHYNSDKQIERSDILEEGINFCTNLVLDDINKYDINILIITNTDDYIYYLEKNINFKEIISIGDNYHNELYKKLLTEDNTSNLYLVKNVDLYTEIVEDKSKNKFIYISEYSRSRNIIKDCRVLYMKYKFNYERSIQFYKELYKDEEIIEIHCNMIRKLYKNKLEKKYSFSVKDLELIIKNKGLVSLEYLKYLVYYNKLDKEEQHLM